MSNEQKNIEKARELYLTKGILKRELIRDEVVYSWVRARLMNLDSDKLPSANIPLKTDLSVAIIMKYLSLDELGVSLDQDRILSILHFDDSGSIKNAWSKSPIDRYYFSFLEENLGTNGIGLTLRNHQKSMISGFEHYHKYLIETVTIGIPTSENEVIGLVLKLDKGSENHNVLFNRLPNQLNLQQKNKQQIDQKLEKSENGLLWPACLKGSSRYIEMARERVMQFKDRPLIFITGPKGIGKETTASFIHKMSKGGDRIFHAVYCDKIPLERFHSEWLEDSKCLEAQIELYKIGTVYFENFDVLPMKFQRKLLRLLDSKLVNSNAENNWYQKNIAFILSSSNSNEELGKSTVLTNALQSRLKLVEISLPPLAARKEDVCPIFEHMITVKNVEQLQSENMKGTDLYEALIDLELESNLRDLDLIAHQISDKLSLDETIDDSDIDMLKLKYGCERSVKPQLRTLSDVEKEAILNTLEALNFNMVRTAATLGISRSTLYRKIDHYKIALESVR